MAQMENLVLRQWSCLWRLMFWPFKVSCLCGFSSSCFLLHIRGWRGFIWLQYCLPHLFIPYTRLQSFIYDDHRLETWPRECKPWWGNMLLYLGQNHSLYICMLSMENPALSRAALLHATQSPPSQGFNLHCHSMSSFRKRKEVATVSWESGGEKLVSCICQPCYASSWRPFITRQNLIKTLKSPVLGYRARVVSADYRPMAGPVITVRYGVTKTASTPGWPFINE